MDETKFNVYTKNIANSIDYKKTLHIINTYLLEMQSLLDTYDFNKRIHDLRLIVIIPENDDAVTMFETYTGLKLLNKKAIIDKLREFNNYKYKRIYSEFFNNILSNGVALKQYRALFDLTDVILPSNAEKSVEDNIYNLQYILRSHLNKLLDNDDVGNIRQIISVIKRICGGEDKEILKALDTRRLDDKEFLDYNEITFIRNYFDLDEFNNI